MRIVPLPSSASDPESWSGFPVIELNWAGNGAAWRKAVQGGLEVHALHFPEPDWSLPGLAPVLEAQAAGLGADFLVLGASAPATREARMALLGALEFLLEALKGPRLVLRGGAHSGALAALLREVRGEAIGFCWDAEVSEFEAIADRCCCAVAGSGADLSGLARLGYRWNLALPSEGAAEARREIGVLADRLPGPEPLPMALGPEPEGFRFGSAWGEVAR